jgi:hypothetical protein
VNRKLIQDADSFIDCMLQGSARFLITETQNILGGISHLLSEVRHYKCVVQSFHDAFNVGEIDAQRRDELIQDARDRLIRFID